MRRLLTICGLVLTALVALPAPAGAQAPTAANCTNFASQAEAQAAFQANPAQLGNLDINGDGVACETWNYAAGAPAGEFARTGTFAQDTTLVALALLLLGVAMARSARPVFEAVRPAWDVLPKQRRFL